MNILGNFDVCQLSGDVPLRTPQHPQNLVSAVDLVGGDEKYWWFRYEEQKG